jgi:hypothetical protein
MNWISSKRKEGRASSLDSKSKILGLLIEPEVAWALEFLASGCKISAKESPVERETLLLVVVVIINSRKI